MRLPGRSAFRLDQREVDLEFLRRIVLRGGEQLGADQRIDDAADIGGFMDAPLVQHLLREDAEKTLAYFRRLPREQQRKALALLMSSEGGRASFDRAINTATNRLSPQDREQLGPTFKIWKEMLEEP